MDQKLDQEQKPNEEIDQEQKPLEEPFTNGEVKEEDIFPEKTKVKVAQSSVPQSSVARSSEDQFSACESPYPEGDGLDLVKKCVIEAIGSTILYFITCASAFVNDDKERETAALNGHVIGCTYAVLFYTVCYESGCHLNPAITLAMAFLGHMDMRAFTFYIAGQFAGGFIAPFLLACLQRFKFKGLGGPRMSEVLKSNGKADLLSYIEATLIELVLTFLLVFFYIHFKKGKIISHRYTGLLYGVLLNVIYSAGSLSGPSLNPAGTLGVSIFQAFKGDRETIKEITNFIIGPLCGGVLAGFVSRFI